MLADEGLAAAVEALAEEARVPIRIGDLPEGGCPRRSRPPPTRSSPEVAKRSDGRLVVRAEDADGARVEVETAAARTLDLVELEDRVGALDGRLAVEPDDGRVAIRGAAVRVVIADDETLLREGLARLLADAGFEVVGKAGTPDELLRRVELTRPDVAIVDIRMPPTHTDEGLVAAQRDPRRSHRRRRARALALRRVALRDAPARGAPGALGYLLKERVSDLAVLVDALERIDEGECVLDPTIVARLVGGRARGARSTS